jgi:thiamine biosynthesis lipoprotein
MNTFLSIKLPPTEYSDHHINNINKIVQEIDKKLNVYTIGSDLYRIKQNAGYVPIHVDDETFFLLEQAYRLCQETDGVFDITIGPLVELYRFDDSHPHVPSNREIHDALQYVDYQKITLNAIEKTVYLPKKGMYIDLSGILKGYTLDKIADYFHQNNIEKYFVDFGGNLCIKTENPLYVGIENPSNKAVEKGFYIHRGFVSTSSSKHQSFQQDGTIYTHIIHPKTGSAIPIISSVTVATWSGLESDFLSTYFFLVGRQSNQDIQNRYVIQSSIYFYHLSHEFEIYAENYSS